MIVKTPAKINLGLHIKSKRPDGFHEIESIFYPIPLFDFVELISAEKDSFNSYGIEIPGNKEDNLCIKALKLLRNKGFDVSPYEIHLLKNIPIGAGLGGGSSNAVAVLKAVNVLENLNLSTEKLMELAAELGSDCPFFCLPNAALVTGRGEHIKPIDFSLKDSYIHLVYPNLHISSGEAYGAIDLSKTHSSPISIPEEKKGFQRNFINDFQAPLEGDFPVLQRIKDAFTNSGAYFSSLSGSGSSMFGLFKEEPQKLFRQENWKEWILRL